jgi:hypothetical protein
MNMNADFKVNALLQALSVLESNSVEHWVCNGTLLGIVRDGALIPWDNDIDIAIIGTHSKELIQSIFALTEFVLIDDGGGTHYLTYTYEEVRVDFNFFHERGSELVSIWRIPKSTQAGKRIVSAMEAVGVRPGWLSRFIPKTKLLWSLEGYSVLKEDTFPLGEFSAFDEKVPVPRSVERTLEHIYGSDWRTPMPDYDWRKDGANNAKDG